jgi:acetyl-CoA carboxylase biotin carboxyl carrier protein
MPSEKPEGGRGSGDVDVFDLARVRQLVELMKEHELTEIELRQDERRIRLRSGAAGPFFAGSPGFVPMASAGAAPAASGGPAAPPADDENVTLIRSPMVGTFYLSPKPGEPPFVKVGDQVQSDTIVCIIEAMKMFNEIPAGVAGRVVGIVARNEEPVDVGRPLFRIIAD